MQREETRLRQDDASIVAKACENADAFSELYLRHVNSVYRYLMSLTCSTQDAEDLTAQTFVAALEGLHLFDPDGNLAAWLIGIAKHKYLDQVRAGKRLTVTHDLDEWLDLPDERISVEDTVQRQLEWQEVTDTLDKIKSERAEALRLRVFAGLTSTEIGEMLGKSEGAVNNLVYRAIQDIRRWLGNGQ
jgi:RNA polymerase sigma-70 factor (ECF subfamily)